MNYLFTSGGLQQVRCELEIRLFHIIPQLSFSPVSYVLIRLARNRIRYDDLPWSRFYVGPTLLLQFHHAHHA
jgi:hypothetical protein